MTDTADITLDRGQLDDAPLLVVENLKTHFMVPGGAVKAVDGVSLSLERGKTLGVVGESGSGKTILSRSMMGLNVVSNAVTTGSVKYAGMELVGRSPKQMKHLWGVEMAMVFQDPMTSLNPVVKVGRQLTEHVRQHLGMDKKAARNVAIELLKSVRIPEPEARFDNYPHQMSGGMRQRVCIAIALACGPKMLFADEPTTALDVTVQHQILNLLAAQQRDRYMTMIMVTHDLGVVAGRTDEIAVMYAGKVVEKAPTGALFADMHHPYTQALLWSIPKTPRCPYAQDRCREEEPTLRPATAAGHEFACHFPIGTPENEEAFQRNLDAGRPQTLAAAGRMQATDDLDALEMRAARTAQTAHDNGVH